MISIFLTPADQTRASLSLIKLSHHSHCRSEVLSWQAIEHCYLHAHILVLLLVPRLFIMRLPTIIYQVLFGIIFVNCLFQLWVVLKLVYLLPSLGTKKRREEISIKLSTVFFRNLMLRPCLWLNLRGLDDLDPVWRAMNGESAPYILANHNSKLDSLLITAILPTYLGPRMRSLIKLALFSEPLFGGICTAAGHFPVYYKGSTSGMSSSFWSFCAVSYYISNVVAD